MKPLHSLTTRALSCLLAALLAALCIIPASAAEVISSGVEATYDEAYYVTTDYYGNLTEGSVVKSYVMNGAASLTDYGAYDEVINLTDGTLPHTADGCTTFDFAGAPSHFYFEGKTAAPFETLPWKLSMHYTLNGVPTKAEELAGKCGVVEIFFDAVPNKNAAEYARNNYTLEAMAIFNQDDILSLEAEGAQIQLIGNLRAVLFVILPGEEQHFSIRVGCDHFSFGGMTFLMVPATLSQLSEISKLAGRKDDIEENYRKLSDSLDVLLDSVNGISSNLYVTADGLDELNTARGIISNGKGSVYADAGVLRGDLNGVSGALQPVAEDIGAASQALADSRESLKTLNGQVQSLRPCLQKLEDVIEDLQDTKGNWEDRMEELEDIQDELNKLNQSLKKLPVTAPQVEPLFEGMTKQQVNEALTQAGGLHSAYLAGNGGETLGFPGFVTAAQIAGGTAPAEVQEKTAALLDVYNGYSSKEEAYAGTVTAVYAAYSVTPETAPEAVRAAAAEKGTEAATAWATANAMKSAFTAADTDKNGVLDFSQFVTGVLLVKGQSLTEARSNAASLSLLYSLNDLEPQTLDLLLDQKDTLNGILKDLNNDSSSVSASIKGLVSTGANLTDGLSGLIGDVDDFEELLDALDQSGDVGMDASRKGQDILDGIDALYQVIDAYEPKAQAALQTVNGLTASATQTVDDASAFFDSFESLLKTAGAPLDSGTKKTLEGLAASLRATANSLGTTGNVKSAKNNISGIVEDVWNEYTGEANNLLLIDANAAPQSLTDSRNPSPTSIQVLIRTQEIKETEPPTEEIKIQEAAETTFFQRVAQMFKDFWTAITGIFR